MWFFIIFPKFFNFYLMNSLYCLLTLANCNKNHPKEHVTLTAIPIFEPCCHLTVQLALLIGFGWWFFSQFFSMANSHLAMRKTTLNDILTFKRWKILNLSFLQFSDWWIPSVDTMSLCFVKASSICCIGLRQTGIPQAHIFGITQLHEVLWSS